MRPASGAPTAARRALGGAGARAAARRGEVLDERALLGPEREPLASGRAAGRRALAGRAAGGRAAAGRLLQRTARRRCRPTSRAPLADPERYQTVYAAPLGLGRGADRRPALHAGARRGVCATRGVESSRRDAARRPGHLPAAARSRRVERPRSTARASRCGAARGGALAAARAEGRRVVAVGTTVRCACSETLARDGTSAGGAARPRPLRGTTTSTSRPGYRVPLVDALLTNFHLPRTSLLALVMAFCGVEQTRAAYAQAVARRLPVLQLRRRHAGAVRRRPTRRRSHDDGRGLPLHASRPRRRRPRGPPARRRTAWCARPASCRWAPRAR